MRRTEALPAKGKRRVTIERYSKGKLDADNLVGGCKGFIDAMRAVKLLVDDSPSFMELLAFNRPLPRGHSPHTVITLEDL